MVPVLAKFMSLANLNRIVIVNLHSVSQVVTTRQPIAVWHIFIIHTYKFWTFLMGQEITDSDRLTDSAVISLILL